MLGVGGGEGGEAGVGVAFGVDLGVRERHDRGPGFGEADRRRQPVASLGHVLDVAGVCTAVSERLLELGDPSADREVGDRLGAPDPLDELAPRHGLAGALGQDEQDVHCASFELDRGVIP